MAECGSAAAALDELPRVAAAAGVTDYVACPADTARAELRAGRLAGARLLARGDSGWPAALDCMADPPPLLWVLGNTDLLNRSAVGVVGARSTSSLGLRMARLMAGDLSRDGQVIVSGLARGIDTAAHLAALDHGTIAVMAGGVDVVYPTENAVLAQEIADRGLRISDQPMGTVPQARHFPARNRLVAALSRAVVVVEAAARSGSLITARAAMDLGREVMVVPGHPLDGRAAGCNMLIRDGAVLVRGARDVTDGLPPLPHAADRSAQPPAIAAPPAGTAPPAPASHTPATAANGAPPPRRR